MRKTVTIVLSLLLVGTFFVGASLAGDTLADVKAKGVLVAGIKDSLPPFGYVDQKTRTIVGYDIDFVNAIAKKLGVKVELKPVTSATRMPQHDDEEPGARKADRLQLHLLLHRAEVPDEEGHSQ
jgi:polar amino acid transport system substrate-binding protein